MCTFGYLPPSLTFCQSVCTLRWELMSDSDIPPLFLRYRRRTARRAMSVKISLTVETGCTTSTQQIAAVELEVYSWSTCCERPRLVDSRIGVVNEFDRRRRRRRRRVFYIAMLCIRGTSHGPVSVRLSVCPSQVGVSLKRLNAGSHKQHHTIAQGL